MLDGEENGPDAPSGAIARPDRSHRLPTQWLPTKRCILDGEYARHRYRLCTMVINRHSRPFA
jgi:hypothetical protein